jgi:hypothetical protein
MAPTMPVSAPLAGGSKSAIAPCVETSVPENAVRVSRLLAWCGNFLTTEDGAHLPGFLRVKQELPGILTACSFLTSGYQPSNDHADSIFTTSHYALFVPR